jgi:hypothetical protein
MSIGRPAQLEMPGPFCPPTVDTAMGGAAFG